MRPDVRLQVGRLAVNSVTSVKRALVSFDRRARGPHASSRRDAPPRLLLLLSGHRGGRWGHGRGGRVGQRGVAALSAARRVAALRVGRHGPELAVQVGEDAGHGHDVGPFEAQRLPHLPVLARPVRLPREQAHRGRLAGRGDRGGSVEDRPAGYRNQALGSEIVGRRDQRHCYLDFFWVFSPPLVDRKYKPNNEVCVVGGENPAGGANGSLVRPRFHQTRRSDRFQASLATPCRVTMPRMPRVDSNLIKRHKKGMITL